MLLKACLRNGKISKNDPETAPFSQGTYPDKYVLLEGGIIMPRLSKKEKLENAFFYGDNGRKKYNSRCRTCIHDCKQSFRADLIACPKYKRKEN